MIKLNSLHILLTYTCNYECDHCFVWGSPWQQGTFKIEALKDLILQAKDTGTIESICFEGGEPFLYYGLLREGIQFATQQGFRTGLVTNAYWANSLEDTSIWLSPLKEAGLDNITISSDDYHGNSQERKKVNLVMQVANKLGLKFGDIEIDPPAGMRNPETWEPGLPLSGGDVLYRGRAAELLVFDQPKQPWRDFKKCLYERLDDPGRVHVDPFGNLHLCQGIVFGNVFQESLKTILEKFIPSKDPIIGPLIDGGPAKLIKKYYVQTQQSFVDACHACYTIRLALRHKFPDILKPEQMYGFM